MSAPPLRTVLVGFGKIGASYAADPVMARYYPYATHAQVLRDHPEFNWGAAVDLSEAALEPARTRWGIERTSTRPEGVADFAPEVAVIATPPESRIGILDRLPSVRGVLVEKPLGRTLAEGQAFLAECRQRNIVVHVAIWRRYDAVFRALAAGGLRARIGRPQAAVVLYGNGLLNNGTHMIDFVRMTLGDVRSVQAVAGAPAVREGPTDGDLNVPFTLVLEDATTVACLPLRFANFRENGIDVWGEEGRLTILQEGLSIRSYTRRANRAMAGEREVDSDTGENIESTVGRAFYEMYSNVADSLRGRAEPYSPGESSLRTARIVEAVLVSSAGGGAPVAVG